MINHVIKSDSVVKIPTKAPKSLRFFYSTPLFVYSDADIFNANQIWFCLNQIKKQTGAIGKGDSVLAGQTA